MKWTKRITFQLKANGIMKCIKPGCLKDGGMIRSPRPFSIHDYSTSGCSSCNAIEEFMANGHNIEEAESSLRGRTSLTDEEARALMGRLEYQRGNIESALQVFDGIDIAAVAPQIKSSMLRKAGFHEAHSYAIASMSIHAISLLFEAMLLKAKSLQCLTRYKEAAISCTVILDIVESVFPDGLPVCFAPGCKLQKIICQAVELLPEIWKLAGFFQEVIISFRRAVLYNWNLDQEISTKLYKDFAIFLLYCGNDATPPNLRCHIKGSFFPNNNIEEAILLFMILLRRFSLEKDKWDMSIFDHLVFALTISGNIECLAKQIEELLPGVIHRKERYYTLALCYLGKGDCIAALNLLKKILHDKEDPNNLKALLMASKICVEDACYAEEGVLYAEKAINNVPINCDLVGSFANCVLGVNLSAYARSSVSDSLRVARQSGALEALNKAKQLTKGENPSAIYYLSLEYAEQRKLDSALHHAKTLIRLEAGSNLKGWILLARILSAQQRFADAETITDVALEETGRWDQGELLSTKAKIQTAQGKLKDAIETYTNLLAILQMKENIERETQYSKGREIDRNLSMEVWHELAKVYTSMSMWNDAETCLAKLRMIKPFSTSRWHGTGKLLEAKGLLKEAIGAYENALAIAPDHVPSLVSVAVCLKQIGNCHFPAAINFLTEALRIDRTNHEAWYELGALYKALGCKPDKEVADCFQAAALLQDSAPVQPFR